MVYTFRAHVLIFLLHQGDTGKQGNPGVLGHFGLKGTHGDTGLPGRQGPKGPGGLRGVEGAVGPAGITGPSGHRGHQGDKGSQGDTGLQGPVGSPGPQGPPGPPGLPTSGLTWKNHNPIPERPMLDQSTEIFQALQHISALVQSLKQPVGSHKNPVRICKDLYNCEQKMKDGKNGLFY